MLVVAVVVQVETLHPLLGQEVQEVERQVLVEQIQHQMLHKILVVVVAAPAQFFMLLLQEILLVVMVVPVSSSLLTQLNIFFNIFLKSTHS